MAIEYGMMWLGDNGPYLLQIAGFFAGIAAIPLIFIVLFLVIYPFLNIFSDIFGKKEYYYAPDWTIKPDMVSEVNDFIENSKYMKYALFYKEWEMQSLLNYYSESFHHYFVDELFMLTRQLMRKPE